MNIPTDWITEAMETFNERARSDDLAEHMAALLEARRQLARYFRETLDEFWAPVMAALTARAEDAAVAAEHDRSHALAQQAYMHAEGPRNWAGRLLSGSIR